MKTPAKPCNGRFSDETVQALLKNVERAQWLPHTCELCGQLLGARLEKGHWVPEPHWPSVVARRTSGSTAAPRKEAPTRSLPVALPLGAQPETRRTLSKRTVAARGSLVVQNPWSETLETIDIPVAIEEPLSLSPEPVRVFVVDDEFNIASTLQLILRHHGFEATAFTGPLEALEAVLTQAPDLLLSDIAMPQLSGVDLAMRVREIAPACKILLFSGESSSSSHIDTARAMGHSFEVLSRPLHPVELLKRISKLTEGAA
jgi:CheY-like chemotaxis protein